MQTDRPSDKQPRTCSSFLGSPGGTSSAVLSSGILRTIGSKERRRPATSGLIPSTFRGAYLGYLQRESAGVQHLLGSKRATDLHEQRGRSAPHAMAKTPSQLPHASFSTSCSRDVSTYRRLSHEQCCSEGLWPCQAIIDATRIAVAIIPSQPFKSKQNGYRIGWILNPSKQIVQSFFYDLKCRILTVPAASLRSPRG